MKKFTEIIKYFTSITTGIVLVFIVIILIQGDKSFPTKFLFEIPCASLATSLLTILLAPDETSQPKPFFLRVTLHYIALCVLMTVLGVSFGWVKLDASGILTMILSTAGVYVFTYAVSYFSSMRDAEEINSALNRKNKK